MKTPQLFLDYERRSCHTVDTFKHILRLKFSQGLMRVRWSIFAYLVQQDRQRKQAQERLERLLQEALDSDSEPVNPTYWQNLRASVLGADSQEI